MGPAYSHQNITYMQRDGLEIRGINHARDGYFLFIFLDFTSKLVLRRGGPRIQLIDWGVCLQEVWCQRSMAWAKLNGGSMIEDVTNSEGELELM